MPQIIWCSKATHLPKEDIWKIQGSLTSLQVALWTQRVPSSHCIDAIFLDVSAEFLTKSTTVPKPPSGMLAPSTSSDFQSCRGTTCKPMPNVLVAELLSNSDFSPLILSYFVLSRFVETSLPAHMIVCLKSTASVCVTARKQICFNDRKETRRTW